MSHAHRRRGPARVVLDGMAIRAEGRGVARSLRHLLPILANGDSALDYVIVTTDEGRELLGPDPGPVAVVPTMPYSAWEQVGLAWHGRRLGARAIYTFAECGPLWGPPTLLHIPEDPRVRWRDAPPGSSRERLRRLYQRATMTAGARHAQVVAACSNALADALAGRVGTDPRHLEVVPLGVDMQVFHPSPGQWPADAIFHLGSSEPRDETVAIVRAYAHALALAPDLPDLVIAGDLGPQRDPVMQTARQWSVGSRVRLLGRISDEELRHLYSQSAMCAQPARYEGFGLQPLEALACGAPLIVSSDPAVREVIGNAAVVVPDVEPRSLAVAMADLWQDVERRRALRHLGPKRASEFTWTNTARKLDSLLQRIALEGREPEPGPSRVLTWPSHRGDLHDGVLAGSPGPPESPA